MASTKDIVQPCGERPPNASAASTLFRGAQALLRRVVDQWLLRANAVVGFWPANA